MKPATTTLINFLNTQRQAPDVTLPLANAFVFTFQPSGNVMCYTDIDVPFTFTDVNNNTYAAVANSARIDGLKYKAAIGLDVDQQQVNVAALSTDTITGGAAFLQALRQGAFDGCEILRYRIFFQPGQVMGSASVVGAVLLFKGRMGVISLIGRTSAKFTVNSDLILLDNDMPRNLYQPTCVWKLYGPGCTLAKGNFGFAGTVGANSTPRQINWNGASTAFQQGTITFTSGVASGVTATVGAAQNGAWLTMIYPLEEAPNEGDGFVAYYGCDHTLPTCQNKFNNRANFRGFPYVPPVSQGI
jgi:uncharacterized phage protein (TIGR02218 family)